ncbi:MAG: S-layer homology domain-containing protein [Lachnospirales bacterium]
MKKTKKIFALVITLVIFFTNTVMAEVGDMGFFGGISQGRRLLKTTDILLGNTSKEESFPYKEMIFINGEPIEFQGIMEVEHGEVDFAEPVGTYEESYKVSSSAATGESVNIDRNISFIVNYRIADKQIIKDYRVDSWSETITANGTNYELDEDLSFFELSLIEDLTPGVEYYKGNVSKKNVYVVGEGETVVETVSGDVYGYGSSYSTIETHRLNGYVNSGAWQMQYQVRPSVSVMKTLDYGVNEPNLISFDGNYREIISNQSGLKYNIYVKPTSLDTIPDEGGTTIDSYNTFEQLLAPNLEYLKGHFAEADISKLFAMEILEGKPKEFVPNQAITRGQYITMIAKAIALPIDEYIETDKKKKVSVYAFPDVPPTRPDYPYIMAANNAGLAFGRQYGHYYPDSPITREEALVILLRTIGLENLGLDPTPVTAFTDDEKIANWAKKELYAAERIGLIRGDENNNIHPKNLISKGEAAALINRLIDYMRKDMINDYGQNIVHFAN